MIKISFVETEVFPHGIAPVEENEALKLIEVCGRTAYKSEDKITEDSAVSFVLMLKKHRHLSVLEHSNIVFEIRAGEAEKVRKLARNLQHALGVRNVFHRTHVFGKKRNRLAIAGNLRSWIESMEHFQQKEPELADLLGSHLHKYYPRLFPTAPEEVGDIEFQMAPMNLERQMELFKSDPDCDIPVFLFRIICDRGITHEIVRHRVLSFTQESTRYVNYKNKGMTLILPEELRQFYDPKTQNLDRTESLARLWLDRAELLFRWYQEDLGRGLKPQIARDILPNLLKSDIFVSGRWSGWRHFISLRDSGKAHPRIAEIARRVRDYFDSVEVVYRK